MTAGPRAAARVGQLPVGEQAVREPRAALERALQALDLDQVDADADGHASYFSPRTALNSALSPLLPEPVTR